MNRIFTFMLLACAFASNAQQRGGAANITVTELNYNSDSTINPGNWIELHNVTGSAVNLSGWQITDANISNVYTVPNNVSIPANGYLVVTDDTVKFKSQFPAVTNFIGELSFGLSNNSDQVNLYDFNGSLVFNMTYYDSFPWPKAADGYGRTLERVSPSNDPNLFGSWFAGCMGGSPGRAYTPCDDDIVISEINYNNLPQANSGDWFELHNRTNAPINISNWEAKDSRDTNVFVFPAGTILPANGYIVASNDTNQFKSFNPTVLNYVGQVEFNLANSGDALRLFNAQTGKLQYSMVYRDDNGWPIGADGNGYTLELGCDTCNVNAPTSWFDGCIGGSPGHAYFADCSNGIEETNKTNFELSLLNNNGGNEMTLVIKTDNIALNKLNIDVFDLLGQRALQLDSPKNEQVLVNISTLTPGMYIIRVSDGKKQAAIKFTKAN